MRNGVEAIIKRMEYLKADYEKALQVEDEARVAYRAGVIDGMELAVKELERLDDND